MLCSAGWKIIINCKDCITDVQAKIHAITNKRYEKPVLGSIRSWIEVGWFLRMCSRGLLLPLIDYCVTLDLWCCKSNMWNGASNLSTL